MDTGEIAASREQLASDAGTNPDEVSRAIGELAKIGAILRRRCGRRTVYFVNPTVGWNGGEGARQEAAKGAPQLRLIETSGEQPLTNVTACHDAATIAATTGCGESSVKLLLLGPK